MTDAPHREQQNWNVVNQSRAVAVLQRAVKDPARLAHAYLFAGPEAVGRATVARRFAQALNCEKSAAPADGPGTASLFDEADLPPAQPGEAPCDECRACRLIAEDKHPDIERVGVGGLCEESEHKDHEGSRDIRICQVRRIERVVSRTAVDARYRVIVIDPADTMTHEAANGFLKTLEEPAPNVVLVLITAREEALPETVRSRCRRVAFFAVPRDEIEAALRERWGAERGRAELLARMAQGRLGWAVAALEDERILLERERLMDEIESVLSDGVVERFAYAASLGARFSRDPEYVRTTLDTWSTWCRDVFLVASGREDLVSASDRLDRLRPFASQYKVSGAFQALKAVQDGRNHLEGRANPLLAMEVMLLDLPRKPRAAG